MARNIQHEGRRQKLEPEFMNEATSDAHAVGLPVTSACRIELADAAEFSGRSPHQSCGSPERRRQRRLRAWCIEVR